LDANPWYYLFFEQPHGGLNFQKQLTILAFNITLWHCFFRFGGPHMRNPLLKRVWFTGIRDGFDDGWLAKGKPSWRYRKQKEETTRVV